jgi:hypothetical protein
MDDYNHYLFKVSKVMPLIFIIFFLLDLFKRRLKQHWKMYFIGTLIYYVAFSSGISFWQADRLIIFTLPLWVLLYAIMLSRVWSLLQNARKLRQAT